MFRMLGNGSPAPGGSRRSTISSIPDLSPENMHHPAHTSRHVHKTKLYSPYSTNGHTGSRHGKRESASGNPADWASSASPARPPPPRLRPLADMNSFLGAVFNEDGSVASEIPRSALGLPGITTFDNKAAEGGVKIEPMDIDENAPVAFPTAEDVVIGACTCGVDCECPGCATHANPQRNTENGQPHSCGDSCKSCFDCADHLSIPSGVVSIQHLLSIAAANVPPPPPPRTGDLNGHDTRILPLAAKLSEDAARRMGIVHLKPLECCNGRCQCAPGKCTCEKDCCGCCIRCACGEDADTRMQQDEPTAPTETLEKPSGSCCGGGGTAIVESSSSCHPPKSPQVTPNHSRTPSLSIVTAPQADPELLSAAVPQSATLLSPESARIPSGSQGHARPTSGHSSGTTTPSDTGDDQPSLRRSNSSSSGQGSSGKGPRRASVGTQGQVSRNTSIGKSKALALQTQPRPILPKPASGSGGNGGHLAPPKNGSAARNSSPHARRGSSSSGRSRSVSPAPPAPGEAGPPNSMQPPPVPDGQRSILINTDVSDGVNQPGTIQTPTINIDPTMDESDFAPDSDFMAYLNQLTTGSTATDASIPTNYNFDFTNPFEQAQSRSPNLGPTSSFDMTNPSVSGLGLPPEMNSAFYATLSQTTSAGQAPQLQLPPGSTGLAQSMSDLFLSQPQSQVAYDQPPSRDPLNPDTAFAPQVAFAPKPNPVPNQASGGSASNLIDLSKPLDAADVERILKALQDQQARQDTTSVPAMQTQTQSHSQSSQLGNQARQTHGVIHGPPPHQYQYGYQAAQPVMGQPALLPLPQSQQYPPQPQHLQAQAQASQPALPYFAFPPAPPQHQQAPQTMLPNQSQSPSHSLPQQQPSSRLSLPTSGQGQGRSRNLRHSPSHESFHNNPVDYSGDGYSGNATLNAGGSASDSELGTGMASADDLFDKFMFDPSLSLDLGLSSNSNGDPNGNATLDTEFGQSLAQYSQAGQDQGFASGARSNRGLIIGLGMVNQADSGGNGNGNGLNKGVDQGSIGLGDGESGVSWEQLRLWAVAAGVRGVDGGVA